MRALATPPASFLTASGAPAYGSFRGPLPPIVAPKLGLATRIAKRKKWVYVAIANPDLWLALGVVRTGYAATAFAYVYDLDAKRMLLERTSIVPAAAAKVGDDPNAAGELASFRGLPGSADRVAIGRSAEALTLDARLGGLRLAATLDASASPPPISAIGSLGGALWDATEKRALATVKGEAILDGRSLSLDGGVGGWDYTHGVLPRHTKWRWAFALGHDTSGARLGFNVVEGFLGEAECAAFVDGETHPLPEPRFGFDASAPTSPWRLEADGVALRFTPGAVHAQYTNLGIVRSRFVQPVGTFSGTLRVAGKEHVLEGVPGVVEDQDVVW